jgi:hypothetical protein
MVLYERNLTVRETLKAQPIRTLKTKVTESALLTATTYLVMRASKSNAVYKTIDDNMAVQIAIDLLEKFEFDAFGDIVLMFKYARQGKLSLSEYSKKKSFSETVLQDWFSAYMEIKSEVREHIINENKENIVGKTVWTPEAKKLFRKIRMEFENGRKPRPELTPASESLSMESITAQFAEQAKQLPTEDIEKIINQWATDRIKKYYVHVFEKEIEKRQK